MCLDRTFDLALADAVVAASGAVAQESVDRVMRLDQRASTGRCAASVANRSGRDGAGSPGARRSAKTPDRLALRAPFEPVHSEQRPSGATRGCWVTIWSRLSIVRRLPTTDPERTTAAELAGGIIVYGTVLPWHTDRGPEPLTGQPVRNWSEFMRVTPTPLPGWGMADASSTACGHALSSSRATSTNR
jgi:hypothetical protein